MKPSLVLSAVFSIALLASIPPNAHAATCTVGNVAGNWAGTLTGTLLLPTGPVPIAAIVRATLKMDGTLTGTEARSVGGDYADETASGTWTVKADCTGTLIINFYQAGELVRTSVVTIVFDNEVKEVRMVQKSLTLPDGTQLPVVVTVEGRKQ